jgi:hypothetical protein
MSKPLVTGGSAGDLSCSSAMADRLKLAVTFLNAHLDELLLEKGSGIITVDSHADGVLEPLMRFVSDLKFKYFS